MSREFARILELYGQQATVYTQGEPQGTAVRAFFQPVLDRGTAQAVPSPMGEVRQDRFLYLGPPETPLECAPECGVEVGGELYRPQAVQPVYIGGTLSHYWAVLTHRAQEAV